MSKGRFDPMPSTEAAALGRALLASIRGQALSPVEQATLAGAQAPEDDAPMPILEEDELLASFARGDDAEVQVSWRRFRGSSGFLDLRRFERGARGSMRATKQGVTIRGRELGQLLAVLVQAAQRVEPEPAQLELVSKRSAG